MSKNILKEFWVLEFREFLLKKAHLNDGGESMNLTITKDLKSAHWFDTEEEAIEQQSKHGGFVRKVSVTAVTEGENDKNIDPDISEPGKMIPVSKPEDKIPKGPF